MREPSLKRFPGLVIPLLFHVVKIKGFCIIFEHGVMPDGSRITQGELKIENFICFPPGRQSSVCCTIFEAFMGSD